MKQTLLTLAICVSVLWAGLFVGSHLRVVETRNFGGTNDYDLTGTITSASSSVQAVGTKILSAKSGRQYFRISNTGAVDVYCGFQTTSTNLISVGIRIVSATSTTAGVNYYDSGEAGITYNGEVWCRGTVTSTVATIEK